MGWSRVGNYFLGWGTTTRPPQGGHSWETQSSSGLVQHGSVLTLAQVSWGSLSNGGHARSPVLLPARGNTSVTLGPVCKPEGFWEAQTAKGWIPRAKCPVLGHWSQLLQPVLSFPRVSVIPCHTFLSKKSSQAEAPWRWL